MQNKAIEYDGRFKDAPWYNMKPNILVGGVGGIGGNALYCLTKSIPGTYYIIDDDVVSTHNIGSQFFRKEDVGKPKVEAIKEAIRSYTDSSTIFSFKRKIDSSHYMPITIAAFDNMAARKQLFEIWKNREDRELYIDGRLRASLYEIYAVTPGREEEYEKTLFSDDKGDDGPCTFKQTAYFGMLIGARITHILVNFLTNKALGENVANVPFFITEVGEPLFINIIWNI